MEEYSLVTHVQKKEDRAKHQKSPDCFCKPTKVTPDPKETDGYRFLIYIHNMPEN